MEFYADLDLSFNVKAVSNVNVLYSKTPSTFQPAHADSIKSNPSLKIEFQSADIKSGVLIDIQWGVENS